MKPQSLLIAGGSGLIGSALKAVAEKNGWHVTLLSRTKQPDAIQWDPATLSIQLDKPIHFDAIVNLAGSSLSDGPWNEAKKRDVLKSRLDACLTLETYLSRGLLSTEVYIGASGIGIYGDRKNEIVTEETAIETDHDWLVETVVKWEEGHHRIGRLGIRTVIMRIGIVLSLEGGALSEIIKPAQFGVLPWFGSGEQYWPWIHIEDVVRIVLFAIEKKDVEQQFIAVAPAPATNRDFIKKLNAAFSIKRISFSAPIVMMRIMLGEKVRILTDSCRAHPKRLSEHGFQFKYDTLPLAFRSILQKR